MIISVVAAEIWYLKKCAVLFGHSVHGFNAKICQCNT